MVQLLFVTTDRTNFADLSAEMEQQGALINWANSGKKALEIIGKTAVDLVLTDETVGDMTGLEFIERLVAINPMVNCAAVSSLPEDVYHEASEGLGILVQLPPRPDQADGQRLMAHLNQILDLTTAPNKK